MLFYVKGTARLPPCTRYLRTLLTLPHRYQAYVSPIPHPTAEATLCWQSLPQGLSVATLTLRQAQAEELLFLANRLLKPKPPLRSQRHTLTEFLAKLAKGSGGSPPWQQVSTTWLQHAVADVVAFSLTGAVACPLPPTPCPWWLNHLAEQQAQLNLSAFLQALLDDWRDHPNGHRPPHGQRLSQPLPLEAWQTLAAQHYLPPFPPELAPLLAEPNHVAHQALWQWGLVAPLPWAALFEAYPATWPTASTTHPFYTRAWQCWQALQTTQAEASSPSTLAEAVAAVQGFRRTSAYANVMAQQPVAWPVRLVVLVEGPSEETFLTALAHLCEWPLKPNGVWLKPVGGKQRMLETYNLLRPWLACPMVLLLDKDAENDATTPLQASLAPGDSCWFWPQGELEDAYPLAWLALWLAHDVWPQHPHEHPAPNAERLANLPHKAKGWLAWLAAHAPLAGRVDKASVAKHVATWLADKSWETLPQPDDLSPPDVERVATLKSLIALWQSHVSR